MNYAKHLIDSMDPAARAAFAEKHGDAAYHELVIAAKTAPEKKAETDWDALRKDTKARHTLTEPPEVTRRRQALLNTE